MPSNMPLQNFVTNLLQNNLPSHYYYHNVEHTLYVMDKAIEIGLQEKCTEKEIGLLQAAALWHDAGCINTYANHEEEGCNLAKQYLPGFGYSSPETDIVCGMIMATKIPHSPKNKLEEIIVDADLEYLGTDKAASKAALLFKELQYLNPALTETEWIGLQISFLQKHHYFTPFCIENREPVRLAYLNKLITLME